jgi:(3,5-dihydroxyphenyl)acetyl-CoA 1,2-dioxygenase
MIEYINIEDRKPRLIHGGIEGKSVDQFLELWSAIHLSLELKTVTPALVFQKDTQSLQQMASLVWELMATLPTKSARNPAEKTAGQTLLDLYSALSWSYFRRHASYIYASITDHGQKSVRVDDLLWQAAQMLPGILPTKEQIDVECTRMLKDKDGIEINQGLFVSQVFSDPACGHHLNRSMLRPTLQAQHLLEQFIKEGEIDLGVVKLKAVGNTGYIYLHNERYLNAEDDTTVLPLEQAVDLILLHPKLTMGVLRGSVVDHPKYKGKRIFCSGINLTRIYQGKQSFVSFLFRSLALHNKLYRGILPSQESDSLDYPLNEPERTQEKPWVAVVETFAIGGGCQLLLVVDYVIAERDSYFSLPARKEGILPGSANIRLTRFLGERLARQAIMFDKLLYADSPEGKLIANEVVQSSEIEAAIERVVQNGTGSGMVSAGANRRAIRIQTEPLEMFRKYMATYALEQAFCNMSEQLISNLEKHWNAKERKL